MKKLHDSSTKVIFNSVRHIIVQFILSNID